MEEYEINLPGFIYDITIFELLENCSLFDLNEEAQA